ncbi:MAG: ribosome assembly RNA-binding protein YhbY [Mariprofundaceae bacterium]|nr:ribosome assembly RNA-binding protein YhbY [Mariprofundaceae bacterium]
MSLTSKQRKALKAQAHHLNPVIRVGQNGISEGVIKETDIALNAHELIKVQLQQGDRDARLEGGTLLADRTGAELVHHIGRIIILYRPGEEK